MVQHENQVINRMCLQKILSVFFSMKQDLWSPQFCVYY